MTFKDFIYNLQAMTFHDIVSTGTPRLPELVDEATTLFQTYAHGDQMIVLALMFGMLTATLEGETTMYELEDKGLISYKERLQLFEVLADITYRAAMAERTDTDAPDFVQLKRRPS